MLHVEHDGVRNDIQYSGTTLQEPSPGVSNIKGFN